MTTSNDAQIYTPLTDAAFAEGVFTPQHTLAGAQEFYRDLKARMRKYERACGRRKSWK